MSLIWDILSNVLTSAIITIVFQISYMKKQKKDEEKSLVNKT